MAMRDPPLQVHNNTPGNVESDMRKEDRIRQQHDRNEQQLNKQIAQPKEEERIKGGSAADQPARPPRQSGKLPLPD
jgi:hypothetical protein